MGGSIYSHIEADPRGHYLWRGRVQRDRKSRPIWHMGRLHRTPQVVLYEQVYGVTLGSWQLQRQCEEPTCVAPLHHLPAAPSKLLCALLSEAWMRSALVAYIRSKAAMEALYLFPEDLGRFGLDRAGADDIATRFSVPVLAALAAYARVVRESGVQRHGAGGGPRR